MLTPFQIGIGRLVTLVGGFGTRLGCAITLHGGVGGGPVVIGILHVDAHGCVA